jgi:hypothetical protein
LQYHLTKVRNQSPESEKKHSTESQGCFVPLAPKGIDSDLRTVLILHGRISIEEIARLLAVVER